MENFRRVNESAWRKLARYRKVILKSIFEGILLIFIIVGCDSLQSGVAIKGLIVNLDQFDAKGAYLQLVNWKLESSNGDNTTKMTAAYDIHGNLVEVEFVSELPKLEIPSGGKFKYTTESVKPGTYILAVQKLSPKSKRIGYSYAPHIIRPLTGNDGKPIVLTVTKNDPSSFSIDLDVVQIGFHKSNKFFISDLGETTVVRP